MKRTITLLGMCLLLLPLIVFGQATKAPQWKSRAEYDAYQVMLKAATPQQKIQAADAFLQKYPASDFKFQADFLKAQEYQQLGQTDQAIAAAKDSLKANPDNPDVLNYLSYVFPYTFKPGAPNSAASLTSMSAEAKHGLQLLQQLQKPPSASQQQFDAAIKNYQFDFNRALGFVALQQKDSTSAINYLKAAVEDSPNDSYTFYFLGQAYLGLSAPDYNDGIWSLARSVSLAQKSNAPILAAAQKAYSQWYEYKHGSNAGEKSVISQAASSATPPAGFKVGAPPKHAKTGNAVVDAFYGWQDALGVGGDTAQSAWNQIKGQPYGVLAYVASVQPGSDPGSYNVRATVIPDDKGQSGMYNLILQTNQEDAKYLKLGNPITFRGTISSYTASPSFVVTVSDVQIDQKVLDQAAAEAKLKAAKAKAPRRRVRRR